MRSDRIKTRRLIVAGVLTALLLGYAGPVNGYLDQRAELTEERAKLERLRDQRASLRAQLAALNQDPVLEARARELGLVRPGERAFRVRGRLDPPPPRRDGGDDGGGILPDWIPIPL